MLGYNDAILTVNDMVLQYFNLTYFLSLAVLAAIFLALFFLFRKRSERTKFIVLCVLIFANVGQHLCKMWVWPQKLHTPFGLEETAYNVCAALILLSPVALLSKSKLLKQFVSYVGSVAGLLAICVPYWHIGSDIFAPDSDFLRSWTCHALLFWSSLLPAVWGMVKFPLKDGWKIGLLFFGVLGIVMVNNVVFSLTFGLATPETLYAFLQAHNAMWHMGPSADPRFQGISDFLVALCPPVFRGGEGKMFTPILWYAMPVYLGITALVYSFNLAMRGLRLLYRRRKERRKTKTVKTETSYVSNAQKD